MPLPTDPHKQVSNEHGHKGCESVGMAHIATEVPPRAQWATRMAPDHQRSLAMLMSTSTKIFAIKMPMECHQGCECSGEEEQGMYTTKMKMLSVSWHKQRGKGVLQQSPWPQMWSV